MARTRAAAPPPRTSEPAPGISILAEATVPAAAILVPGFWEAVGQLPNPDHFDDLNLGALWTAIIAVHRRAPVTRFSVAAELREMGWDEAAAFAAMQPARPEMLTLPEALAAVDALNRRKLRRLASQVCNETLRELESAVDVEDVVQRHELRIVDVATRADDGDGWTTGDDVSEERLERLETGIRTFDRVNGGLASGVLTILAARPGMGKSALATAILRNVSSRGIGCGCNSLEMPALDLIHRAAAAEAYDCRLFDPEDKRGGPNPTYSDYERRMLHGETLEIFEAAKRAVKKLPIRWDEKQGRTIGQIRMGGRRLRTIFGREAIDLRLLVVDHLGKIRPDEKHSSRHLELGEISDGLMQLAAELRIPVLALCQLSREVEKRPDKRPNISDLRESGRLEEDAHTVLLAYRQAYYDDQARERGEKADEDAELSERYVMELNTAKFRGGVQKRVRLFCDIGRNFIGDEGEAKAHLLRPVQTDLYA